MLPQVNAELVSITTGSTSEDWDEAAGVGLNTKWSGSSDAYLMEKTRTVFAAQGGFARTRDVTLIIPATLVDATGGGIDVEADDTVTYIFMGTTHSRKVMDITSANLPGLGIQQYIRLHLRPEAVETPLEAE